MSKDYYSVLGVAKNASADEIKTAFRKKAHEHHPDKGGDEEKFKEYNEAYQVLGNKEKRKQYDQFGSSFQSGQAGGGSTSGGMGGFDFSGFQNGGVDMDDLFGGFGDIFGFGGGRSSARESQAGQSLEFFLDIDFKEAIFGCEKEVSYEHLVACKTCDGSGHKPGTKVETCSQCGGRGRVMGVQRTILGNIQTQTTCPKCHGEGKIVSEYCDSCGGKGVKREKDNFKVKIPAGINDGESLRIRSRGDAGIKGAPSGDLFLRMRVRQSSDFERVGFDIKNEQPISVTQAVLGGKLEIKTVHGLITLKIPEGTQSGTVFRLKDKGVPKLNGKGVGDHFVKINVIIPKNLTKKQKQQLLEANL